MKRFRDAKLPVAVDPKTDLAPYKGASLLKPNLRETEVLSGIAIRRREDLSRAVARLRKRIGGGAVVVTRGADGMSLFDGDARGVDVATASREVFDVQGRSFENKYAVAAQGANDRLGFLIDQERAGLLLGGLVAALLFMSAGSSGASPD